MVREARRGPAAGWCWSMYLVGPVIALVAALLGWLELDEIVEDDEGAWLDEDYHRLGWSRPGPSGHALRDQGDGRRRGSVVAEHATRLRDDDARTGPRAKGHLTLVEGEPT